MTRKIRSLFRRVKAFRRSPSRARSPQQEIAHLRSRLAHLVEENFQQAGYINFLTGQCITFECDRITRAYERGEVVR
jgi:hypothetical protein